MTVINRALDKAYKRRAESEPVAALKRPGSGSISGWASKLREPLRSPDRPVAEPAVLGPPVPEIPISDIAAPEIPISDITAPEIKVSDTTSSEQALPETTTNSLDAGHSTTAASAPALLTTSATAQAQAAPPVPTGQWSWPPIVQRLLTCPAAPELLDLAVQLRALAAGNDLRSIACSGPGRQVGRTSLVLTLASVLIADKSTRVAIVDADFNHPQAAQLISLHPAQGLEEAIDNPRADAGVVTTLLAGRLSIVPLVKPVAAEALDSRRIGALQAFLRSLRREFDIVLIDAGPWKPGRLPLLLECRAVDAVVCVCRASSLHTEPADERNSRQAGVEWLGVVETFADSPPKKGTGSE